MLLVATLPSSKCVGGKRLDVSSRGGGAQNSKCNGNRVTRVGSESRLDKVNLSIQVDAIHRCRGPRGCRWRWARYDRRRTVKQITPTRRETGQENGGDPASRRITGRFSPKRRVVAFTRIRSFRSTAARVSFPRRFRCLRTARTRTATHPTS